ncbi:Kinase, NEK [Giardia muris]|uniref:Kinase, NEK n=1 Tax=Giardia muris TaxID=5742 RepID=A0A4Z1T9H3_GIAMU|nr:Kinase, NEK [Giardia muris]|eukprot:TNJ29179.1 Kinase, NEK [Giardia muris]
MSPTDPSAHSPLLLPWIRNSLREQLRTRNGAHEMEFEVCVRMLECKEEGLTSALGEERDVLKFLEVDEMARCLRSQVTPLMCAVIANDIPCLKYNLLWVRYQTTDKYQEYPAGMTALMFAVHLRNVEAIRILLPYENDLLDDAGQSSFHYLTNSEVYDAGADDTHRSIPPELLLALQAPINGSANLIGLSKSVTRMLYPTGLTPLMLAVVANDKAKVNELCSNMVRFQTQIPLLQYQSGATALMFAVFFERKDLVSLLVEQEGRLQDKDGLTALMHSIRNGQKEYAAILARYETGLVDTNDQTALIHAIWAGHDDLLDLLLEAEASIPNRFGWSALMVAAQHGSLTAVRRLLFQASMQSTSPKEEYPIGTTALILASRCGHPDIVELLIPKELHLTDSTGKDALWYAQHSAISDVETNKDAFDRIKELLKAESDRQQQDFMNRFFMKSTTPALVAQELSKRREVSGKKSATTVEGCVELTGLKGITLMRAAEFGHIETVMALRPLEARRQDAKGWTALMYAVKNYQKHCVDLLLCERDLKNQEGKTAEDLVKEMRNEKGLTQERQDACKDMHVILQKHKQMLPGLPDAFSTRYHEVIRIKSCRHGNVYVVFDTMGHNRALKVVDYENLGFETVRALRTELQVIPTLKHDSIIPYHDVFDSQDDSSTYIVMDWCVCTLEDEIKWRKRKGLAFSDLEVVDCLKQVAAGLEYLHNRRVIHRDVKSANVFVTVYGGYVLGDFGLIGLCKDDEGRNTIVGTESYMAPELIMSMEYTKTVDVWALGVVAYEICTGDTPFKGIHETVRDEFRPIPDRPPELNDLISRMLSKLPEGRPTAEYVYRVLRKIRDRLTRPGGEGS